MDLVSFTASIIAILQLSSKVLGYLNDVKNASKDREQCAIEASNLYCLLINLRFRLEDGSIDESWYTAVRALGVENGPLDQYKQALEQLQMKITGGRVKKVGDALVWKFNKQEITSILARMERLKTLVQVALQMDHFKLSQAIKERTDVINSGIEAVNVEVGLIRTHISTLQSGLDAIRQDENFAQHDKLMEWISPLNFPTQQSDFIARRQHGTGQWFLDAPEFTNWLYGPNKTLFCPGVCGAGKTMMAAIAIDGLSKKVRSGAVGLAYVYCNYKAQVDQNAANLLAAILKQLVQARPSIAEPVERLHKQHAYQKTTPSLEEIFNALQSVCTQYSRLYIVIDALDECPDGEGNRNQFLAKLRDLQSRAGDLRVMTTSRFIPSIMDEFSAALRLEIRASDEDIKQFVAGQIYRLPKCIQRDNMLQDMVQEKILHAVDGLFILAQLHVNSLLDKRTKTKVQCTLATLSRGSKALDKAYDSAIERIKGQMPEDSALASNVLSWIIHAQRPLTTEELCHALAVQPDNKELDLDNIFDIKDIISACAGLVTVDEKSNIIRLVHYTTQQYFEQFQKDWNPSAQLAIASTCLTYLSFSIFKSGSCTTDKEFESRLAQNPFLDYAACFWGRHTLTVQEEVCELACSFLQHSGSVSSATQAMFGSNPKHRGYSQDFAEKMISLHLTARFGLLCLLEKLLSRLTGDVVISVNLRDSYGQTPLWFAAKYGHKEVVKLLIDKGAEVNVQGGLYGNALHAASEQGDEQIVKVLLDKGAEVNVQGGLYGNALYAASVRGHEQIVKLLLDKGAEVNAQGGYYCNALHVASDRGYEQIVRVLLDKGAEVNAQIETYGNSLQTASAGGYKQIVKLLLDKGGSINAQGGKYGNSLVAASAQGHERIVKLLLDKGAEVNAQSGYYCNALHAASERGHEQIVKVLLDKGAEVNAQSETYGNSLQTASAEGYKQIVELLLDKGGNINAQGGFYGNALQAASARGHEQIVKLLLDNGAEVNAQGGFYGNALHSASAGGYKQIVELLLDKGGSINAQGGKYGNSLVAASAQGHERIVKLLLDKGAEVNGQGRGRYGNSLIAASARGYEQIVKLLLDKGAKVTGQGGEHGSTLHAVLAGGHEQISKLLLDKSVGANAQGGICGNALHPTDIPRSTCKVESTATHLTHV